MKLKKMWLKINGANRMIVCDPENDTLAEYLRRLGLTGTKVGCNIGVCGACSVLLDGKVVRSCTRKMKNIPEWSEIITIEGIGTPTQLHPLQKAWIKYGGVQCGFCTPGFIVSSYGLLLENPSPTREDVRDWFQKHRNACRCTGYKPLVDSVMAAAAVMRGDEPLSVLDCEVEEDIYGSSYPRPTALARVCGVADYGDDVKYNMPAGTLHLAIVLPKSSHANIINVDASEALAMPGVVDVMTGKDILGTNSLGMPLAHPREKGEGATEIPIIAEKKIYRRGDPVAVIIAETEKIAWAAVDKVKVELEQLPEYLNFLDAVAPGAMRIHENKPNLHLMQPVFKGEDATEVIDDSDFIVEGSFKTAREPHMPIEPDTLQAYWGEDGLLTVQCKSHFIYGNLAGLADAVGIDPSKVRVIANTIGGSFGYATDPSSYAIAAAAVMKTNMPCTLTMPYEVHQHFTGKRSVSYSNGRLGATKDGKITGAEFEFGVDHGPFSNVCNGITGVFVRFPFHGYYVPSAKGLVRMGLTNHGFATAYRGFGCPQSYTCSESLLDMMAAKIGMDPFEFRYKNIAVPGNDNLNSYPFREYPLVGMMDLMRPYYEKAKAEAEKNSTPEKKRGIGLSLGGYNVGLGFFDQAEVDIELCPNGIITVYDTWEDIGQGGDIGTLTHATKALSPLGIKPEQIRLNINDSKLSPNSGIAAGSRSHYMVGNAIVDAANNLMDAMRKDDGTYRTYDEMIAEEIPTKYRGFHTLTDLNLGLLDPNTGVGDTHPTYMYGINMAEVEVDVTTGKTEVLGMTVISDVGVIGNMLAVEGQAYGGLSHCVGYALSEEYDDLEKHTNILASGIPYCNDVPDNITLVHVENPRELGPFGSAGCSENFQSSAHMSIINAIYNASGARIYDLPARPEKVKSVLDQIAKDGEQEAPKKYFLGSDFYEEMEDIKENPVG